MLDKKDISLLKGMFKENNEILKQELRVEIGLGVRTQLQEFKNEIHTGIRGEFQTFKREVRDEMSALIVASEKRIVTQVAELLDTTVLPQIDDLQVRVTKLETARGT